MEVLFLEGSFKNKIWGGTKLRDKFGYNIPSEKTGSIWAISAHSNGPSVVKNGRYKGRSVAELWDKNRELFGNQEGEIFPLLIKIIDAKKNLSVQVHPDDTYGLKKEGELGKTECWYVLSAEPGSEVVLGHNASSKEELHEYINKGQWKELLRTEKVEAGDFIYIPSGTVHAIGEGVMVLETQQTSDVTYRLYDYNRKDNNGNKRKVHIDQSIEVMNIPYIDEQPQPYIQKRNNSILKKLIANEFFTVYEWLLDGEEFFKQEGLYTLVSVIGGKGEIYTDNYSHKIKKGDHFIIPSDINNWKIIGNIHIIASHP